MSALASAQQTDDVAYPDPGFVYIFTNPGTPGIVKIGITKKDDVTARLKQLYTTGVIWPFECAYAARVPDCSGLEKILHRVFHDKRANAGKEFFHVDPALVRLIIDLVKIGDRPLSDAEQGITPAQRADIEAEKSRTSRKIDFEGLGLAPSTILHLVKDPSITCTVSSKSKVLYQGQQLSPSLAAVRAINSLGYKWPAASGSEHWAYQGTKLSSLAPAVDADDQVEA